MVLLCLPLWWSRQFLETEGSRRIARKQPHIQVSCYLLALSGFKSIGILPSGPGVPSDIPFMALVTSFTILGATIDHYTGPFGQGCCSSSIEGTWNLSCLHGSCSANGTSRLWKGCPEYSTSLIFGRITACEGRQPYVLPLGSDR